MKAFMVLQFLIVGLFATNAHAAAKVAADAGAKINAACLAQTAAAKAAGRLFIKSKRADFCECIAGNHVRLAKRMINDAAATSYVKEVLSFYEPLNESESAQARAAFPESNDMDFGVVDKCESN